MRKKIIKIVMKSLYEMTQRCVISLSCSCTTGRSSGFKSNSLIAQNADLDPAVGRAVSGRVVRKPGMVLSKGRHPQTGRRDAFILHEVIDDGHRARQGEFP